jgi:predicted restriction endonuclease
MFRNFDDPLYKKWRTEVYKRDNFCCQWPGCNLKSKLNAHHIKRWADCPGLRYEVSNGITLCKLHHKMIHNNETYYEAVFRKIVANNNDKR